jgi:hypothetical protein
MQPLEIKLELRHLNERVNAHVLTLATERGRSAEGTRSLSSAA